MATAIAIRFPLGRYHATPWHRAVNEGEIEWPPSAWRLLRGLIATRHQRWPDLPEERLDELIAQLVVSPPGFRLPPSSFAHTRHYLPDQASSEEPGSDLVLDPYVWMQPAAELVVRWDVELDDRARQDLARLCRLVPYLGRSESISDWALLDEVPDPDDGWTMPCEHAVPSVHLLQPDPSATRKDLEASSTELRRERRSLPARTRLRPYRRVFPQRDVRSEATEGRATAIRWQLQTRAPFTTEVGILATDRLRTLKLHAVESSGVSLAPSLTGKTEDGVRIDDLHRHAHWLWLGDGRVEDLALWVPAGLDARDASTMVARSGFVGFKRWNPAGFAEGHALATAVGAAEHVLPELVGPAMRWRGRTPYLPVRRRKPRWSTEDWILRDLTKECSYRSLPTPSEVTIESDRTTEARHFRRYRWSESMRDRRQAFWVSLVFDEPVSPAALLCLGQLSHFGFGLFAPDRPHAVMGTGAVQR